MWSTNTYWFDVAVVMSMLAVGNILFGRFEEHRPKWRRLGKGAILLGGMLLASYFERRWIAYAAMGLMAVAATVIHVWWLPKHGINGWTGEPRDKYLELVGAKRQNRAR
jgi:hypothetical protein